MKVPGIGETRGLFEIFIPGLFLLINLAGMVYLFLFIHSDIPAVNEIKTGFDSLVNQAGILILLIICFGYLMGMILRLFMAERPDRLSAWYHRTFNKKESIKSDGPSEPRFIEKFKEKFPYIGTMGEDIRSNFKNAVDKDQFDSIYDFYRKVWEPRKIEDRGNRRFVNFCKIIINDDKASVVEINAAEATNRYLSGMFYSLVLSFFSILLLDIILFAEGLFFGRETAGYGILLAILLLVYSAAVWGIISRFRFIRIKEALLVFDATYKNRHLFLQKKDPAEDENENQGTELDGDSGNLMKKLFHKLSK
ncbi:MAG: hypothetical protein GY754_26495 [bacterium]|nr:hypothetical protein [bacterium]